MTISGFVSGYRHDPHRIADVIAARQARGDAVYASAFDAANPREQLAGTWTRAKARGVTGIFLRDCELAVNGGKHRRPFLQRAGTCVSRGMSRGIQTSLDVAIADRYVLMKAVEISFAPIYSLARHEIGQDRCGSGDGAILADAAQAVHDFGVATNDLFPATSEDDVERIAVKYAAPGVGTPSSWIAACKGHTAVTFAPDSIQLLFDCLAAGYAVPYAHGYVTGTVNKNGISGLGSYGPHCRCFTGLFVDVNGQEQLISSESWGAFPARQPMDCDQTMPVEQIPSVNLIYAGGTKKLAPGDVGVVAHLWWEQIQNGGEAWAVGAPRFDAASVADVTDHFSRAA